MRPFYLPVAAPGRPMSQPTTDSPTSLGSSAYVEGLGTSEEHPQFQDEQEIVSRVGATGYYRQNRWRHFVSSRSCLFGTSASGAHPIVYSSPSRVLKPARYLSNFQYNVVQPTLKQGSPCTPLAWSLLRLYSSDLYSRRQGLQGHGYGDLRGHLRVPGEAGGRHGGISWRAVQSEGRGLRGWRHVIQGATVYQVMTREAVACRILRISGGMMKGFQTFTWW